MGSTKVFDSLLLGYDAEPFGTFTVTTKYAASFDLKMVDADKLNPGRIIIKAPGIDSAGAMTVQILIQDSADNSSFATVWTGVAWTLAQAKVALGADPWFQFNLPAAQLRRYVRVGFVIGTAAMSAGAVTVGLVK